MKKFTSILCITLAIIFCLGFTVYADAAPKQEEKIATISNDLQIIECDGVKFYRINPQLTSFDYYVDEEANDEEFVVDYRADCAYTENLFVEFKLTNEQKKTIYKIDCFRSNDSYIEISVNFNDGSSLSGLTYINEKYIDEYHFLFENGSDTYLIDFMYPDNNFVFTSKKNLLDDKLKTKIDIEYINETNEVYIENSDKSFRINVGLLITIEDKYYFYEYDKNNPDSYLYDFLEQDIKEITLYEVTDDKLLEDLKIAEQKYLDDDFGFLFDDELAETVSKIFFTIIFAVIPFGIFIASVILGIRSKKRIYKKIFATISVLTLTEVITFIVTVIILFRK